jgi:KaiC/GvpD/RAD55 family RecA-like ATPase
MGVDEVRDVLSKSEDVGLPPGMLPEGGRDRPSDPPETNVTPLRQKGPGGLKPRAKNLLDAITFAGNLTPSIDRDYLVKGWLDRGCTSILYGQSNTGKTFLAVDLANAVSKGLTWAGRRVRKGRVLYIAAEGGGGFANRVSALNDPEFFVLTAPLVLTGRDSQSHFLVEVMRHLAEVGGQPFDLVVIDTMARVMGGADENAAPDIADLMRNVTGIQRATGAHVLIVHHSGKDTAKGARGHSSLRAAVDTEIELTRDDETGLISAKLTKQRDGPTGYRFDYTLRQVELGRDQDGDPVTTCVVEPADRPRSGRSGLTDSQRRALAILEALVAAEGQLVRKPQLPGLPCVPADRWRQACLDDGGLSSSDNRDAQAKAFRRAREDLVTAGLVCVREDLAWVVQE